MQPKLLDCAVQKYILFDIGVLLEQWQDSKFINNKCTSQEDK